MEFKKENTIKTYEIQFNQGELKDLRKMVSKYLYNGHSILGWEYDTARKFLNMVDEIIK